jgi:hypothetical protein
MDSEGRNFALLVETPVSDLEIIRLKAWLSSLGILVNIQIS